MKDDQFRVWLELNPGCDCCCNGAGSRAGGTGGRAGRAGGNMAVLAELQAVRCNGVAAVV